MDWWLLTFFIGAILSLFFPEVPELFQLFLLFLVALGFLGYKKLRSSSGLWFGVLCILSQSYLYHNQVPKTVIDLMQTKQRFMVEGEVTSLISTPPATINGVREVDKGTSKANSYQSGFTKSTSPPSKKSVRFNFLIAKVNNETLETPILVRLSWKSLDFKLLQGSKAQLKVKLKPAHGMYNIGTFNYLTWLKANNIVATGYVITNKNKTPKNQIRQNKLIQESNSYRQTLFDKYQNVTTTLGNISPAEQRLIPVMLALTFGDRSGLNKSHWQVLQSTGTSHLIAISGLHIGLVAGGIFFIVTTLFKYLRLKSACWQQLNIKYVAIILSLVFATIYAYLAGFSLPTQRALIMLNLYWCSRLLGINVSLKRLLLLAVFLLLILSPFSLLTASFWLSFYAVSVIFITLWRFKALLNRGSRFWRFIKGLFVIQLALTVMLVPISAYLFQQTSLVAFFANIVAVPWMSFISIPTALLSLIAMPLNEAACQWFMLLSLKSIYWLWHYLELISQSELTLSTSYIQQLSLLCVGLVIFVFFYISPVNAFSRKCQDDLSRFTACLAPWPIKTCFSVMLPLVFLTLFSSMFFIFAEGIDNKIISKYFDLHKKVINIEPSKTNYLLSQHKAAIAQGGKSPWKVSFFDVGQGLSILISRNDKVILYDTGASYPSGFNMSDAVILPYLNHIGIRQIDKVILSHSDNDHAGGLVQLLDSIVVKEIMSNDKRHAMREPEVSPNNNVNPTKLTQCSAGNRFYWQGLTFDVLWPDKVNTNRDKLKPGNDDSCVLLITDSKNQRVLLTGDISASVEAEIVKRYGELNINVLQVPHHGSKTSSSNLLLRHININAAVVSAGFYNRWNMPVPIVRERYENQAINFYNTAEVGQVIVTFTNNDQTIKTYTEHLRPFWFSH